MLVNLTTAIYQVFLQIQKIRLREVWQLAYFAPPASGESGILTQDFFIRKTSWFLYSPNVKLKQTYFASLMEKLM